MARPDWVEWHRDCDDPGSLLSRRGELVQGHLRARLAGEPAALALGQRLFTFSLGARFFGE